MRTATCWSCRRLFTTRRADAEHCPRCQPVLEGRFTAAAEAAQERPGRGRGHFPKG